MLYRPRCVNRFAYRGKGAIHVQMPLPGPWDPPRLLSLGRGAGPGPQTWRFDDGAGELRHHVRDGSARGEVSRPIPREFARPSPGSGSREALASGGTGRYRSPVPRLLRIALTVTVGAGLSGLAGTARAAPAETTPQVAAQEADAGPKPAAEAEPASQVNELFALGKARFDEQDYDGALTLWGQAYEQAPATPAGRSFRVGLAPHLALAHEYRYRRTGAHQDLQRTRSLLQWHIDHYKALYKPTPEARDHIIEMNGWLADVDRELARLGGAPVAAAPAATVAPPPPRPRKPSSRDVRGALQSDPELYSDYSSGRGMVTGGIVMSAGGGIMSLVALTLINNDGNGTNPAVALTGLAGAGLVAGGVALIVVGSRRKNQAVREARRRVAFLPTGTGAVLAGRF